MPRNIYKLHFQTPVHFGTESGGDKLASAAMHVRADTLFSALFLQGDGQRLLQNVQDGSLWFSDAFPFQGNVLYLPKPVGIWNRAKMADDPSVRKRLKKLAWIPLDQLSAFLRGESRPSLAGASFGVAFETTRVNRRDFEDPLPYQVAAFRFADGCGLYVIACASEQTVLEDFETRLTSLAQEGIGGKTSSGWGKFTVEKASLPRMLSDGLENEHAPCQILLSTALPAEAQAKDALKKGAWLLVRRGGFSYSPASNAHKKHTVFLLGAGSTFAARFRGQMLDVGQSMPHPVWRCAAAGFLGVDIS